MYRLFPIAAVLATNLGVAVEQPRANWLRYLVALSGLWTVAANAVDATQLGLEEPMPFPSSADLLALSAYAMLAAALLMMIRHQAPGSD